MPANVLTKTPRRVVTSFLVIVLSIAVKNSTMRRTGCLLKSILSPSQPRQRHCKVVQQKFISYSSSFSKTNDCVNVHSTAESHDSQQLVDSLSSTAQDASKRVLPPPPDPWHSISAGESNLIVGGQPFSFKCGHVARFADGAAVCQIGHTAVLVTAVSAKPDPG